MVCTRVHFHVRIFTPPTLEKSLIYVNDVNPLHTQKRSQVSFDCRFHPRGLGIESCQLDFYGFKKCKLSILFLFFLFSLHSVGPQFVIWTVRQLIELIDPIVSYLASSWTSRMMWKMQKIFDPMLLIHHFCGASSLEPNHSMF